MDTTIKNAIRAADKVAQYDEQAKKLLGHKEILAHILVKTVDEFKGMNPKKAATYIEGEPLISVVPVEPGLTNKAGVEQGQKIVGMNTENSETNEGLVRFDIIFYVRMKDGLSQIIVNVEAQKEQPTEYDILNRGIFYVCRLISSQKERDFVKTEYNDIKRVFSIWICMNVTENSMSYIHLAKEDIIGSYQWKGRLDLLNIVMIGLSNELPEHDEKYELHRLLGALLSKELSIEEKLNIIGKEYDILIEDEMRKDVSGMCNLGEGIWEEAYAEAYTVAETKMIIGMYEEGDDIEKIARVAKMSVEKIIEIIEKNKLALV